MGSVPGFPEVVFTALRKLMQAPEPKRKPIGFRPYAGPERTGSDSDTIVRDCPRKRRKAPGRSAKQAEGIGWNSAMREDVPE